MLNRSSGSKDEAGRLSKARSGLWQRVSDWWSILSLARQFALMASLVVLIGMGAIGAWVAQRIEHGIVQNTAAAAALYMDALIAPLVQELADKDEISPENVAKLQALLETKKLREGVVALKIWKKGAVIAYSNWDELVGQRFTPTEPLKKAWDGVVTAEFEGLRHEDDYRERSLNLRLLEVYAPVRERSSDRVIAVTEFYIRAEAMRIELRQAAVQSWFVVGIGALLMMLSLASIVRRGSRTISTQNVSLARQVTQLETLLRENNDLGRRVRRAHARTAEMNERFLRRVGSDLHDGPAQLLGLALLQLDAVLPSHGKPAAGTERDYEMVRSALSDALKEIRNLSAGLVLPELDDLRLNGVVELAARAHENRTATRVEQKITTSVPFAPRELKTCVFRFVQEALNNAFKHAGGQGQCVTLDVEGRTITVTVSDSGGGVSQSASPAETGRLGLSGIRDRVEAIGGTFAMRSSDASGTTLIAVFDLDTLNPSGGSHE